MKKPTNRHTGVGPGKYREPWRIKEFLSEQNESMASVARALGISPSLVQDTVRGHKNSRKVLRKLRDMGCPTRYLSLPDDLKPESQMA